MSSLGAAVAAHAARDPRGIAIQTSSSAISWRSLADALPRIVEDVRGLCPLNRPVAIQLEQGLPACLTDLALVEAGLPALPLPPFFTAAQAADAVAAAGCAAIITTGTGAVSPEGPDLDVAVRPLAHARAILPRGTGKISFTSGSTGRPKGLCLSYDHLIAVAQAVVRHVGMHHAGRHLALLPPGILLENVAGFYASLLAGGTYVALPGAEVGLAAPFHPDFPRMVDTIERLAITSLILVPEYLAGLVATMEARSLRLPLLTLVAVGGARIPPALLDRAAAIGLPVRQGYGLTECGSVVALEAERESVRGSVGTSIGLNGIKLEADGEIVIRRPLYLGTIGAPRPPGPLHTGDIGRMDEAGRLFIEGRKSNLIITSFGRNISPEWIEATLVERPEILQAMVRGDGEPALDALIVPASPDADIAAAVAEANAGLPVYAKIARWQVVPPFTPANAMLTGNGRLRRAAIAAAYGETRADRPFFERLAAETREAQARFAAIPQLKAGLSGRIGRSDYLAYLGQAYHHVRHTVPLMEEARRRLAHRPLLVAALDDYIQEEIGHEAWILDDIDAAGGDSAAVAAGSPAPATAAMVDHAYQTIRTGNPAAFFGMVYVLEGTSVAMADTGAAAIRSALGLPPDAFRYLTSHGALDQEHMRFFEGLMNRIDDAGEQAAIIAMAKDMFRLFGGLFQSIELEVQRAAA